MFKNLLFTGFGPIILLLAGCSGPSTGTLGLITDSAMVVSAHPLASQVGVDILRQGGNAVDAAIAVQFTLAVVYPAAGNIGGGGFMVVRLEDGQTSSLDFREKAPLNAFRNMYLDDDGAVIDQASRRGHLASGTPGTVDGMIKAYQMYGSLEWAALVQPAIDLASQGFPLTQKEVEGLNKNQEAILETNTITPVFILKDQWLAGDTIWIKDLAATLRRIRDQGRAGFYEGKTAGLLLEEMKRGDGLITREDLKQYSAIWRNPVTGRYKDYTIISMGPPSSGGIALIQLLKMVEKFPVNTMGWQSADYAHLLIEAEKRVFADRAKHLGDADFYPVPVNSLISDEYIRKRMESIKSEKATPSDEIYAGDPILAESPETTHFSIIDAKGNAVAVTTTLNGGYGSKVVVGGAGFFLNNEMDDFSVKPGYPNMFGLVGGEANAIEPGKRMLSSMTPTIVERNNELFMVVGSPGGSKIITAVFQTLLNVTEFNHSMQEAVEAPRFHHQWKPDVTVYETGRFTQKTINVLGELGHQLKLTPSMGRVDGILMINNNKMEGGADPRGDDTARGY